MGVAPRMMVAVGALLCQAECARRGVVLWSHGRSASDALAGTLKDSANFSYCNGLKEGFGNKHDSSLISKKALDACRDRDEMLTHVMPVFLDKPGNALTTPKAFFRAARDRGFKVVVAVWRENVLARQVSSFELMVAHGRVSSRDAGAREHFCGGTLTQQIEDLTRAYRDGVNAARDAGLKVVERTFDEPAAKHTDAILWGGRARNASQPPTMSLLSNTRRRSALTISMLPSMPGGSSHSMRRGTSFPGFG